MSDTKCKADTRGQVSLSNLVQVKRQRWGVFLCLSMVILLIFSVIYTLVGEIPLPLMSSWSDFQMQVFMDLRLPRLLAAILVGSALATSGASLQVMLQNPLAEPGIIGISGGASLAMVLTLLFIPTAMSPFAAMLIAMSGAMLFTLIIVGLAHRLKLNTSRLLLVGVALGILSSAIITWSFYFSDNFNLRLLMNWIMGSISSTQWPALWVAVVMLPAIGYLCLTGRVLDKLLLGEESAKQLGVDVQALRWKLIIAIALLVGGAVSLGGVISFVGLVVPHLIRLALGNESRYLLPMSAILGAILLVFADFIARVAFSSAELPLGVVTTTIGVPVFIWILLRRSRG